MSSSKLRGVLDERTSDQRRRRKDQRDALKSFVRSETSADREERDFHFAQQRENNNENNNKARKKGRRSREKRGVLREIKSHLQISFAASFFCVFLAGGSSVEGRFFCSKFEKKTLEAKTEERKRKRKRKRNIALYEKKDNTATTEQRQKSQHSSLVLYSSLVYVVYK